MRRLPDLCLPNVVQKFWKTRTMIFFRPHVFSRRIMSRCFGGLKARSPENLEFQIQKFSEKEKKTNKFRKLPRQLLQQVCLKKFLFLGKIFLKSHKNQSPRSLLP